MIEETLIQYLENALDTPAYTERPEDLVVPRVEIQRTGGGGDSKIKNAVVAIQSYGETLYSAAALNEDVKDAMESLTTLENVSSCILNNDYDFTNYTGDKQYRYQAVYQIVYY